MCHYGPEAFKVEAVGVHIYSECVEAYAGRIQSRCRNYGVFPIAKDFTYSCHIMCEAIVREGVLDLYNIWP